MGARVKAECRHCYTQFAFDSGGGMRFYELHCDTCGNTKRIGFSKIPDIEKRYYDFLNEMRAKYEDDKIQVTTEDKKVLRDSENLYYSEIENYAGQCKCGGYFKKNAKPRCPNCKSSKIKKISVRDYYD